MSALRRLANAGEQESAPIPIKDDHRRDAAVSHHVHLVWLQTGWSTLIKNSLRWGSNVRSPEKIIFGSRMAEPALRPAVGEPLKEKGLGA